MSSPKKPNGLPPREDHASAANGEQGEQDQGIPFKGPNPSREKESAIANTPEPDTADHSKASMASAIKRDSFKNIGQRRRSSASNQPAVNLRRAQGYSKENEMARNVGA